jgi:hypothetical protein
MFGRCTGSRQWNRDSIEKSDQVKLDYNEASLESYGVLLLHNVCPTAAGQD